MAPRDPPPGWPLPPAVLDGLGLPKLFQWESVGNLVGVGIRGRRRLADCSRLLRLGELFVPVAIRTSPASTAAPPPPVNIPPHHRVNLSLSGTHRRLVGSFTASYTDRAFWTDVLAIQGWTDRFWLIGATRRRQLQGRSVYLAGEGHQPRGPPHPAPHLRRYHSAPRHDRAAIQTLSPR